MEILNRERLNLAKRAYSTRRVPRSHLKTLITKSCRPKAGDLVLAEVVRLGSHKRLELPSGRKAAMNPGDEIIVAYGDRYAPDQYEAYVPEDLEACHLVAAGGVASRAASWHDRLAGPTQIKPLGLLGCGDHKPVNLADFALGPTYALLPQNIFMVLGTSMNAGKTITVAGLVKGFTEAGHTVGAAKITGTAAGGDPWLMRDNGAREVLDFTDAGYATTFNVEPHLITQAAGNLVRTLARRGCDTVILEVADGLYQSETAALARMESLTSILTGTLFAAGDAMGAVSGARELAAMGHNVLGLSGAMTCSPLAVREAEAAAGVPVYRLDDLMSPATVAPWAHYAAPAAAQAKGA